MASIYEQTIINATNLISKSLDRSLSSDGYNDIVFNSAKINMPKLHLEQTKVQIKKEEISFRNAPPGIAFSSRSSTVEFVIYSIPISGDKELLKYFITPYIDPRSTYIEYNTLYYKRYSNVQISGNDELINNIKAQVVEFTTNVNASLKQFEEETNEFYETKLKPFIDEFIKLEIAKRNLSSDSESKLNPFA